MKNFLRAFLFSLSAALCVAQSATGVGAPGASASSVTRGGTGDGTVTQVSVATTSTTTGSVATDTTTPVISINVIPTPSVTGNSLISGGGVGYVSGLNVTVGAASYIIQGVTYSSAITNLSAAAADPTNPRFDVVAVNSSGVAVIITGTPSATPVKPQADPDTQLELTSYLLAANATSIPVTTADIYFENTEWTMTKSGSPINLASTNNPYSGTVCIEATAAVAGNSFTATKPAAGTFDPATYNTLFFYIRNKAAWANAKSITIQLLRSGVARGSPVTFKGSAFGFNSQTGFTAYQQIAIPTTAFAANGVTCDAVRFSVLGGGGSIGFYVDAITLQSGISPYETSTKLHWAGNYSATLAYNINDVVLSSGIQYVAIQAGLGHTPASSTDYWQASSANSGGTVTSVSGTAARISSTGGATPVLDLIATAVTPTSYTNTNLTVDAYGRIIAASNGSSGSGTVTASGSPSANDFALFTTATNITKITPGTGVATAFGNATGGTGGFTTFSGAFGTPTSLTLTNATGLPVGGITGFGTGVATWLATPSFINLSSAVTGATLFSSTTKADNLQAAEVVTLTSSSTDTYAGTAGVTATAYTTSRHYTFIANTANTGAASLNIDSLGAKTIVKVSGGVTTTLSDNDIRSGQVCDVVYDGTNFQIQSTLGNASGGGGSPGGSTTQIQYNNAGAFGGITNATTDGTTLTLTSPKVITALNDTNGNELFKFTATASAVNELTLANAATGNSPTFTSSGGDANIGQNFTAKGTGVFTFNGDSSNLGKIVLNAPTGQASNFLFSQAGTGKMVMGVSAGTNGIITGSSANDFCFYQGNTNAFLFSTDSAGANIAFKVLGLASAVNGVGVLPSIANNFPVISTFGSDTNISLFIQPKGTGNVTVNGTNPVYSLAISGTAKGLIGIAPSSSGLVTGSVTDDFVISSVVSKNILFTTDAGTSVALGIVASTGKVTVSKGITPDGGGLKHSRVTTGSVSAGSTALVTITWSTAFADANYTVAASVVEATTSSLSLSVVHVESVTASAVTVRVLNNAVGSLTGTVNVIAMHD